MRRRATSRSAQSNRTTLAPQLDPIGLPDLDLGVAAQLESSADLEGLEFAGITLDHLDLSAATVIICTFDDVSAPAADLNGTRIVESTLGRIDIPVVRGARGSWRDVRIEASRMGSAEFYENTWQSVELLGCKLGYLNMRGAQLRDVAFVGCTLDELDLVQATCERVSFEGTKIARLNLQQSSLTHVDLRGADIGEIVGVKSLSGVTISPEQLALLAPVLARDLGIKVEEAVVR